MANQRSKMSILARVNTKPGRHVIVLKLVAATGAEQIGRPDSAETVPTTRRELVVALGAEVEIALHVGSACRAGGDKGRPKKKIENGADPSRHDKADQHPEAGTHRPARSIFADVSDHEDVEGGQKSPRDVEVRAKAEWNLVVLGLREDDPKVVLNQNEYGNGTNDGPDRHKPGIFVRVDRLGFAHHSQPFERHLSSHSGECY